MSTADDRSDNGDSEKKSKYKIQTCKEFKRIKEYQTDCRPYEYKLPHFQRPLNNSNEYTT